MQNTPTEQATKLIIKKLDVYFSVECPALNATVYMPKGCWLGHILRYHGYFMRDKEMLIKDIIAHIRDPREFSKFDDTEGGSWFFDYDCHHFKPTRDLLRIAFKKIENGVIIITTAYPRRYG